MMGWLRPDRDAKGDTSRLGRPGARDRRKRGARRRLVVGDIHGCSRTARALLVDEMAISPGDELYLLGDLISKGPDSLGVLLFVEELEATGVAVTIIRGNHEEAILEARRAGEGHLATLLKRTRNSGLLAEDGSGDLDPRWLTLLQGSVYFVELPDAILLHGGVDMSQPDPFGDGSRIVNMRETTYDARVAGHRPVIHGHTRSPLSSIIEALVNESPVLPLDNGAVAASSDKPFKVSEFGNLCCLDLDRWRLHVQPNRDVENERYGRAAFSLTVTPSGRNG
jgi:serine/threonine protein phosphatase 1